MPGKTKKNMNKNNKPKKPSQKNVFAAAKAAKNAEKAAEKAKNNARTAVNAAATAKKAAEMASYGVSTPGELAKAKHNNAMKRLAKANKHAGPGAAAKRNEAFAKDLE